MFSELERFVDAHRLCGRLSSDVGALTETGYHLQLACSCRAAFEQWVTPEIAERDLLGSRLPAFPN
jgi:hypothetical protein